MNAADLAETCAQQEGVRQSVKNADWRDKLTGGAIGAGAGGLLGAAAGYGYDWMHQDPDTTREHKKKVMLTRVLQAAGAGAGLGGAAGALLYSKPGKGQASGGGKGTARATGGSAGRSGDGGVGFVEARAVAAGKPGNRGALGVVGDMLTHMYRPTAVDATVGAVGAGASALEPVFAQAAYDKVLDRYTADSLAYRRNVAAGRTLPGGVTPDDALQQRLDALYRRGRLTPTQRYYDIAARRLHSVATGRKPWLGPDGIWQHHKNLARFTEESIGGVGPAGVRASPPRDAPADIGQVTLHNKFGRIRDGINLRTGLPQATGRILGFSAHTGAPGQYSAAQAAELDALAASRATRMMADTKGVGERLWRRVVDGKAQGKAGEGSDPRFFAQTPESMAYGPKAMAGRAARGYFVATALSGLLTEVAYQAGRLMESRSK